MFVDAIFQENIRCIISWPSICGKNLLKNLIINNKIFDKLYMIWPTSDQYEDIDSVEGKTDAKFIQKKYTFTQRLKETWWYLMMWRL